jgi:two-component system, NtrC family, sensor histidine kinase GlrK
MTNVRQFYPRSFLRLILLGNIVVALPLIIAIAYVASSIESLTLRSEAVTRQASLAARLGWGLPDDLNSMDRILRQYEVLADHSLLDDYATLRRNWLSSAREYAAIPLLAGISDQIAGILDTEARAYRAFQGGTSTAGELRTTLNDLRPRLHRLLTETGQIADKEVESFRQESTRLHERLMLAQALGLGAVLLLGALGRVLITRLWKGFEHAVKSLGEGKLDNEIRLEGPKDMQEVGHRLDWLRRRLLALEEQRTLVLRHVSHELKTPLAALREGSSLLTEGAAGSLTPGQGKIVSIMRNNALRLQALIDGLLKLQQAGYAGERLEPVRVRLDELIQQVLATHQLAARDKHLRFSGSLAPLTVTGGREELTTVVNNLVSNAIKFSPEAGKISLTLVLERNMAVLDVTDEGRGVPAEDKQRIFEPFYRSSNSKEVVGVGLGLAIAREFAVAHGGSLEIVDSSAGAHFRVALPKRGPAG